MQGRLATLRQTPLTPRFRRSWPRSADSPSRKASTCLWAWRSTCCAATCSWYSWAKAHAIITASSTSSEDASGEDPFVLPLRQHAGPPDRGRRGPLPDAKPLRAVGVNQLYSLVHGAVPVVRATGGLADTVVDATPQTLADDTATGFTFQDPTPGALRGAIDRCLDSGRVVMSGSPSCRRGCGATGRGTRELESTSSSTTRS